EPPPLVVELHTTWWRIRTPSTEKQSKGRKKVSHLQYCLTSRQIMLEIDSGRLPLQLMWAVQEVKSFGGHVLAEIHDFRGSRTSPIGQETNATTLSPQGGASFGLGQGPGQDPASSPIKGGH
ncbi:unnamed protein product, partial [Discosporangium mesarthrocarpum]